MKRDIAIEKLANKKLKLLTEKERIEQLEIMPLEDWTESEEWVNLSSEIKKEYETGEFSGNLNSEKYDDILLIWLKNSLQFVTNKYLEKELEINNVTGSFTKLEPCPCCGARTLSNRGDYEICTVCWWEDDGQDNENADIVMGGPNYDISLTQGRINYLKYGIYDPKRKDLIENIDDIDKYQIGRIFSIENGFIFEKNDKWKSKITNA